MVLRHLLIAASCGLCASLSAQPSVQGIANKNAAITPKLHKVEVAGLRTGKVMLMKPSQMMIDAENKSALFEKQAQSPAASHNLFGKELTGDCVAIRKAAEEAKKERLDSVVLTTETTGTPYGLSIFKYTKEGWPSERVDKLWDAATGQYTVYQTYNYTWDEDGYILSEQTVIDMYNYGLRYDYTYNDKKLGITMTTFSYDSGEWTPTGLGEYKYDDRGNIIEEIISDYDKETKEFVPYQLNKAAWDDRGLQTLIEPYLWNGTEWDASECERMEYDWLDAGHMLRVKSYIWDTETNDWFWYIDFTNEFNERTQLLKNEKVFWNKTLQNWSGCETYWGYEYRNMKSTSTYDDRGRNIADYAYNAYSTDGYTLDSDCQYTYEDNADGSYVQTETYRSYTDGANPVATNIVTTNVDAKGNTTLLLEKSKSYGTEGMIYTYEESHVFDEQNRMTEEYYYSYDYDEQNARHPSLAAFYKYDNNDNIVDAEFWNGENDENYQPTDKWINFSHFTYAFEKDTVCVGKEKYLWTDGAWKLDSDEGFKFDYSVPVSDILFFPDLLAYHKITSSYSGSILNDAYRKVVNTYFYTDLTATDIRNLDAVRAGGIAYSDATQTLTAAGMNTAGLKVYAISGACLAHTSDSSLYVGQLPAGVYLVEAGGARIKFVKR